MPNAQESTQKVDEAATVAANVEVAPGFWRMRLACPSLGRRFAPGQFFQFLIHPAAAPGAGPLLRRPFAPAALADDGLAFVYAVVGEGTEAMRRLAPGAAVRLLGPLGRGYTLPAEGRALLVGGGCGGPSLRPVAEALAARGVETTVILGARSACSLLERDGLAAAATRLVAATDDGSAGVRGHAVAALEGVLDELPPGPPPYLLACGPRPMLRGVAALAGGRGLPCQVSLEERMACGFGACMGCAVPVREAGTEGPVYRRACVDGPVFDAETLDWDRFGDA